MSWKPWSCKDMATARTMALHQVGMERRPCGCSFFIYSSVLPGASSWPNQPEARGRERLGDAVRRHQPSRAQSRVGRAESGSKGGGREQELIWSISLV